MKKEHFLFAAILLTLIRPARAEMVPIFSEDRMIASSDFCVAGYVAADGRFQVTRVLFGPIQAGEVPRQACSMFAGLLSHMKLILFLEQDGFDIRCRPNYFRVFIGEKVYTTELLANPAGDPNNPEMLYWHGSAYPAMPNKEPFPTDYEGYCRRIAECAAAEAKRRRVELSDILDIVCDPNALDRARIEGRLDDCMNKLTAVHVDDTAVRNRMASIILKGVDRRHRSVEEGLIRMLARKSPGGRSLELVRSTALDPSDTPAKRKALMLLARIAVADDIPLLEDIIVRTVTAPQRDVLRMAFDAIGELGADKLAFDSLERARLRLWLERFRQCYLYSDSPIHPLLAIEALVSLGHPESLGVLRLPYPGGRPERFEWAADAVSRKAEQRRQLALKKGLPVPVSASIQARYDSSVHWGEPVDGLQAGIAAAGVLGAGRPILVVNLYLRNTADQPLRLPKMTLYMPTWKQTAPVEVSIVSGGSTPDGRTQLVTAPVPARSDYIELAPGEIDGVQLEIDTAGWRLDSVFDAQLTFVLAEYPARRDAPLCSTPVRITVGMDCDQTETGL